MWGSWKASYRTGRTILSRRQFRRWSRWGRKKSHGSQALNNSFRRRSGGII